MHNFRPPAILVRHQAEQLDGFGDVDSRDDEFLGAEPGQLQALHDIIPADERDSLGIGGAEGEDGGGDEKDDSVDDNQPENEAKDGLTLDDEVQSRVEDDRLAGDHDIEADGGEGEGEP